MEIEKLNNKNDLDCIEITEEDGKYEGDILIDPTLFRKIQKEDLDLKDGANISGKEKLKNIMKIFHQRENIIYYGKIICENIIDISDTSGVTNIQLLSRERIEKIKRKIKNVEHRRKIGYFHIGAVQILIKSTFQEGINSPIELLLKDERITNPKDKILGVVEGNLAYVKLKFEIHPNIGIPLSTKRLEQSLTLEHNFLRKDLMKPGDKIFSITYSVGYALTNSHHSITFRNYEKINIPYLFEEVGKIYYPKKNEISELGTLIAKTKPIELEYTETLKIPSIIKFNEPENTNGKKEENDLKRLTTHVENLTTLIREKL
jgi:hypothetical protein